MTTFIMAGKYSAEAVKGISAARTTKGTRIVQQCGGKILAAYATLGEVDLVVVTEFPSVAQAMKASIALTKATGISFVTMPAVSVEEFDKLAGGK